MATDNKKVSGYLPQSIFDLFEDFRGKRSLSASSALITILSEYFKVDQKVDHQSSLLLTDDFVSKERFEALENKLSELSGSLLGELDKLVEQKISSLRSELLSSSPKHIEAEAISVESSLVSELLDEPSNEPSTSEPLIEVETIADELPSEPQDQPQLELEITNFISEGKDLEIENVVPKSVSDQSDLILSEPSNSIGAKLLAKRLNVNPKTISTNKKYMPKQEFYNWLQIKDPDKISWRPVEGNLQDRVKGWIPAQDISSEPLSRLKEWIAANSE
jgi:hypothetical protein